MSSVPKIADVTNTAPGGPSGDEISLLDLLRVLVEQKRVVLGVFLGFVLLGTLFALVKPTEYRYATTIEIGTVMEDGRTTLIDRPETLLAKINEAYIPYVLEQFSRKNNDKYKIVARIPRGSEVIVLESRAPEEMGGVLIALHEQVVEHVKQNHQRVFEIVKKGMSVELGKRRNKLSALQDRHRVLTADLKRLDDTAKLLHDQVEELKVLVTDALNYRKLAREQTGDEAQAMAMLMIDNEIQQNNQRLAALEERLHIYIPREKDSLNNNISDNSRQQQELTAEIAKIQAAVDNIRETRMLMATMRSAEPVGVGGATIILVSLVAGLFAGILAAFIAAFVRKAREVLRAEGRV